MAVSEEQIKEQKNIIKAEKDISKDITQLKISVEKYKEAIIASLISVDQRRGTKELVKQIKSIEVGGIIDSAKIAFGLNNININYHQGKGKLLKTNYTTRKEPKL